MARHKKYYRYCVGIFQKNVFLTRASVSHQKSSHSTSPPSPLLPTFRHSRLLALREGHHLSPSSMKFNWRMRLPASSVSFPPPRFQNPTPYRTKQFPSKSSLEERQSPPASPPHFGTILAKRSVCFRHDGFFVASNTKGDKQTASKIFSQ